MADLINRLLEASIQTAALFWPLFAAFVASIAAVGFTFLKLCAQDTRNRRSAERASSPEPSVYDQDNDSAWMPSSPECFAIYRRFNRRRAAARADAARGTAA